MHHIVSSNEWSRWKGRMVLRRVKRERGGAEWSRGQINQECLSGGDVKKIVLGLGAHLRPWGSANAAILGSDVRQILHTITKIKQVIYETPGFAEIREIANLIDLTDFAPVLSDNCGLTVTKLHDSSASSLHYFPTI